MVTRVTENRPCTNEPEHEHFEIEIWRIQEKVVAILLTPGNGRVVSCDQDNIEVRKEGRKRKD